MVDGSSYLKDDVQHYFFSKAFQHLLFGVNSTMSKIFKLTLWRLVIVTMNNMVEKDIFSIDHNKILTT